MKTFPTQFAGFEHIKRFWDPKRQKAMAKVLPGNFYVTQEDELVSTVLGSCISACIYDPHVGVGGMNHFMLPTSLRLSEIDPDNPDCRYGNWAMEVLINTILKHGGRRERLHVKLFGGGKILPALSDVGQRNICYVMAYLDEEGLQLKAQDIGGPWPRKIIFHPRSGKVKMKKLDSMHSRTLEQQELQYLHEVDHQGNNDDIELF